MPERLRNVAGTEVEDFPPFVEQLVASVKKVKEEDLWHAGIYKTRPVAVDLCLLARFRVYSAVLSPTAMRLCAIFTLLSLEDPAGAAERWGGETPPQLALQYAPGTMDDEHVSSQDLLEGRGLGG